MLAVIQRAVKCFREDGPTWRALQERAMRGQYGWDQSAKKYIRLYASLTAKKPARAAKPKGIEAEAKPAAAKPKAAAAVAKPKAKATKPRAAAKPKPEKIKE
jgi:starch synthase